MKRNNRKGFTLAELLIVVAIIAVLTAIAVPLFVSSLDKANRAVFDSNRSAVKSAGIVAVLSNDKYDVSTLAKDKAILVTGTFDPDDNSKLTNVTIGEVGDVATLESQETAFETWKGKKTEIKVMLTVTEITAPAAGG